MQWVYQHLQLRFLSAQNTHWLTAIRKQGAWKVNVCGEIIGHQIKALFSWKYLSHRYLEMPETEFPILWKNDFRLYWKKWFQQYAAWPHKARRLFESTVQDLYVLIIIWKMSQGSLKKLFFCAFTHFNRYSNKSP